MQIQRKGAGYDLTQYAIIDAPSFDRGMTPELLGEHLKSIVDAIGYKQKHVGLIIGVQDSLLRHAEIPLVPVDDMRLMLRYNSKNYLRESPSNATHRHRSFG